MEIIQAQTADQIEAVRAIFREYQQFLGVDLSFQGFEEELATLPGCYAPPKGQLLLARDGPHAVGCVALRPLDDNACEMKRLFVRPDYRGQGLGRLLALRVVSEATALGYVVMRLDTLETLDGAMHLYTSMGFRHRAPYYANPLPGVVYWERALSVAARNHPAVCSQSSAFLCSDYLILSGWLRLHYLQLGLQSSPLAHTYRFFCSLSLQLSGQENGGFLNRCRYAHQTAENLGFLGNQPGKKFKVSFDDGHTSFLTV